jgi:dolichol kinase
MNSELVRAGIDGVFMLGSIAVANDMYDRGTSQYLTRKVGHIAAGLVFFSAPLLYTSPWLLVSLSLGFTVLMLAARRWAPTAIRGVGGSGRIDAMAEVWYPFACAIAVAVGWGLLHNPWLGVLPTLFLGFGDAITGAIRSAVYGKEVKGLAGSAAMFAVCAALALLVSPYWIGLAGAATATVFEQATTASPRWDDNPALTIGSTLVMAALYWGAVAA